MPVLPAARRDFNIGRSATYAENGVVCTAHPQATQAGLDVLRRGGNAIDAAITAIAMLCVVEPHATGIGGDCFAILCPNGGAPVGINGSGRAPEAATVDWYESQGIDEIQVQSPHAVTIPGAIDAWCRLNADYGTMPMAELLRPAAEAAERGYLLTPRVAADWAGQAAKLSWNPHSKRIYLPNGRTPRAGDRHALPELGATLRRIGDLGRAGFYEGPVAEDIVAHLRELGGLHTLEDFAAQVSDYVDPISTRYRGYDVYEIPPNGQGIAALIILNVMQGYDIGSDRYSEADRIHLLAEATKAAIHRRDTLVADPTQAEVPVASLLSEAEAGSIRSRIVLDKAQAPETYAEIEHADTTYLTVVDKDRNAISFINSLFSSFGSAITAPKSGVILQNRGTGFRVKRGHPNCIAPRKRPMHTIIPGMLMKDGRAVMPFGVMGGHYQAIGHADLIMNLVDHGMDVQEAIAHPRTHADDGQLLLEATVSEAVAADLAARGHAIARFKMPVGGGQAIWIDHERGILIGGSEPRKDGCALGF